ncbi:hypothetical protein HYPSUDRAFT_200290 [Hypholoma sublateritium FD-334 SS-4]|uniref:Uncharacterized protein n=1 Tax=Hypholoma sublateritium (strain FD-334 SS-4) TaxID=945553 RepID=A0A0D2P1H0_HYPSF|nr:hypothetical protein HYPSUDRAFT_200290 [Hypholoma sublateritium FD-334 SS-4]
MSREIDAPLQSRLQNLVVSPFCCHVLASSPPPAAATQEPAPRSPPPPWPSATKSFPITHSPRILCILPLATGLLEERDPAGHLCPPFRSKHVPPPCPSLASIRLPPVPSPHRVRLRRSRSMRDPLSTSLPRHKRILRPPRTGPRAL